jgi:hypothetical protein
VPNRWARQSGSPPNVQEKNLSNILSVGRGKRDRRDRDVHRELGDYVLGLHRRRDQALSENRQASYVSSVFVIDPSVTLRELGHWPGSVVSFMIGPSVALRELGH